MTILQVVKDRLFRRPVRLTREEYLAKLLARGLNEDGTPILNPTPIAPPIGYKKQPSMVEIVRDMVRSQKLADLAAASGHETFEEAEDFNVGDEPDQLRSQWENQHDPDLAEILAVGAAELKRRRAQEEADATGKPPPSDGSSKPRKPVSKPPSDGPGTPPPDPDQDD